MSSDDDYERTLCQLPQVHVFKIPVRKSAEGHRASDWPKDPTWSGKVKIVAKGSIAAIILTDEKTNQVFAVCQVTDDSAVEKTLDSGRYFVLRISNAQGRHAFIGIAFNERNDSFDFNVALSEFKGECDREKQAETESVTPAGPSADFTLKAGEKMKIKFNTKKEGSSSGPAASKGGTGFLLPPPKGGLLAPPPKQGGAALPLPVAPPSAQPAIVASSSDSSDPFSDPFGDFSSAFDSSPVPSSNTDASSVFGFDQAPVAAPGVSDPFDFSSFGDDFSSFGSTSTAPASTPPSSSIPSSTQAQPNLLDF
jgi:hypothetical protein